MNWKLVVWFKTLRAIVATHDADRAALHRRMDQLDRLVRERTDIAVDVRFQEPNYVIVVGRYKNVDYVQTYTLRTDSLGYLIDILKDMERVGCVRVVDAPPHMRAVVRRGDPCRG